MLIIPQTVIIDRYSIAARKTEYACSNSMHLFIECLFESKACLNKRALNIFENFFCKNLAFGMIYITKRAQSLWWNTNSMTTVV